MFYGGEEAELGKSSARELLWKEHWQINNKLSHCNRYVKIKIKIAQTKKSDHIDFIGNSPIFPDFS